MKKTILALLFMFLFGACTVEESITDPFSLANGSYSMPNDRTFVVSQVDGKPQISEGGNVLYTYVEGLTADTARFQNVAGDRFVGIKKSTTDPVTIDLYAKDRDPENTWTSAGEVSFDDAHLYRQTAPAVDPFTLADGSYSMPNDRTFVVSQVDGKPSISENGSLLYTYVEGMTVDTARFQNVAGDRFVGIKKSDATPLVLSLYAKAGKPDDTWTTKEDVFFTDEHLYKKDVPVPDGDPNYVIQTKLLNPKLYVSFKAKTDILDETTTRGMVAYLADKRVGRAVGSIKGLANPPAVADFTAPKTEDTTIVTAYDLKIANLGTEQRTDGKIGTLEVLKDTSVFMWNTPDKISFGNSAGQIVFGKGAGNANLRFNINTKFTWTENYAFVGIGRRPYPTSDAVNKSKTANEGFAMLQLVDNDPKEAFMHVRSFVDNNGFIIPDPLIPADATDEAKWKERIDFLDGTYESGGRLLGLAKTYTHETIDFKYGNYIKVFDRDNTDIQAGIPRLLTYKSGLIKLDKAVNTDHDTLNFRKLLDSNHAIYQRKNTTTPNFLVIEIAGGDLIAHVKDVDANGIPTYWETQAEVTKHYPNSKKRGSIVSGYTKAGV